jgi:uncharacterized membrane protein
MQALRLTKAFSIWVVKALFEKLGELHYEFKKDLNRHPGMSILIWIILSIFWIASLGFITVGLFGSTLGFTFGWVSTILYLVYAIFSNLYTLFKQERKELFETIKNS